jgi:hypothetical protein
MASLLCPLQARDVAWRALNATAQGCTFDISEKSPDVFLLKVTVESYSPSDVPLSVTVLGEPIGNTSFTIKVWNVAAHCLSRAAVPMRPAPGSKTQPLCACVSVMPSDRQR